MSQHDTIATRPNLLTPAVDHLIMEFSRGAVIDHQGRIVSWHSLDKVELGNGLQAVDSTGVSDSGSSSKPVPTSGTALDVLGTRYMPTTKR